MSSLRLASARLIPFLNDLEIYVQNFFDLHSFSFFVYNHDFIIQIDFTRITSSNATTDSFTNYVIHRIFNVLIL